MVSRLASEQMILDWAKEQGITGREEVKHNMEDLLNDATVDFRLEILAGNVEIEGVEVGKEGNKIVVPADPLLTWSIANAKTISNSYGEIKIDKELRTERIDPIDAIIDAWTEAMKEEYRPDINEEIDEWLEMYEKFKEAE